MNPQKGQSQQLRELTKAENTRRAYRSDWHHFECWCRDHGVVSLPAAPETIALYLTALAADHKPASLERKLTSLTKAHQAAGFPSPASMRNAVVSETLKGIRRSLGTAQPGKEPLLTPDIFNMLDALEDRLLGFRDRALLLVGFAGGFRRSELVALDVEDVTETADGLVIRVRRSKTDPEGKGTTVALPYGSTAATCPVRSYRAWIAAAGIQSGPAFRSVDRHGRMSRGRLNAGSVARLIKRAAGASDQARRWRGRSRGGELCRPQPPRRFRYASLPERRPRGLDHAADAPQVSRYAA